MRVGTNVGEETGVRVAGTGVGEGATGATDAVGRAIAVAVDTRTVGALVGVWPGATAVGLEAGPGAAVQPVASARPRIVAIARATNRIRIGSRSVRDTEHPLGKAAHAHPKRLDRQGPGTGER